MKIQSLRGMRVLAVIHVVVFAVFALVKATSAPDEGGTSGFGAAVAAGADTTPLLFAIMGLVVFAGESSRGSIAYTLLGTPRRSTVLLAKASAVTIVALAVGVLSVLVSALVVGLAGVVGDRPLAFEPLPDVAFVGSFLVLAVLHGLLGLGIGAVVPSTAGAVFVLLGVLWGLPLVGAVLGIWVPLLGTLSLAYSPAVLAVGMAVPDSSWFADLGVFALWIAALLAAGWLRFRTLIPR